MSKFITIAAAPALLFAAPAFAQDAGRPETHGATTGQGAYHGPAAGVLTTGAQDAAGGHVKVFDGKTGAELRSAAAPTPTHNPAFNGPHGSASDLTDRPPSDPTAGRATLYGRKAGDDKRQDYDRPAPRPTGGLTKVGTGTLQTTAAGRAQSQNNLKQMGIAHAPR